MEKNEHVPLEKIACLHIYEIKNIKFRNKWNKVPLLYSRMCMFKKNIQSTSITNFAMKQNAHIHTEIWFEWGINILFPTLEITKPRNVYLADKFYSKGSGPVNHKHFWVG